MEWHFTALAKAHMARNGYSAEGMLGALPYFISDADPRGAVDQIDANYKDIGGGWRDSKGWTINEAAGRAQYPGDPPRQLIAAAQIRDERILFFNGAYIAVVQLDGSHRMARID